MSYQATGNGWYCRAYAAGLAKIHPALCAAGGNLVVITPETRCFNRQLKAEARAEFAILSDMDNGYGLATGVTVWLGEAMAALHRGAGWDVPLYQANSAWLLPIPAVFVLDGAGRVVAHWVDPDYRRRVDLGALLEAVAGQTV
ncbi:MAG: hypothetical protein ACFCBW_05275 [Candidatus Competibacterales bacterium]